MNMSKTCHTICRVYLGFLVAFSTHVGAQNPGNIIFTEIMQNPDVVDDASGEWFEIYNQTSSDINLQNWVLKNLDIDGPDPRIISTQQLIFPAKSYFLFAVEGDPAQNGGLPPVDVVFPDNVGTYRLSNGSDGLQIVGPLGDVIDSVFWDNGATFPDPTGRSMQYIRNVNDPNAHVLNNSGSNWTSAERPYGLGDRGTPGAGLEDLDPILDIDPEDVFDFGRTNLKNPPLPLIKDIDIENDGGGTLSILTAAITSGATANFSLVNKPFQVINLLPGKRGDIDISFFTDVAENRTYAAEITLTTNLPSPTDTVTIDLIAEVVIPNPAPAPRSVIINEFCYDAQGGGIVNDYNGDGVKVNPDEEEFAELYNTRDGAVDLSGWSVDDDNVENENTFVFPLGVSIPPKGFLVVFSGGDPSNYPFQTFTGLAALGNTGDRLYLSDGTGTYQDALGWEGGIIASVTPVPSEANGGVMAREKDASSTWRVRGPQFATVGRTNDLAVPSPTVTPTSQPTPTPTPTFTPVDTRSADFDDDQDVDANDLLQFYREWRDQRSVGSK